MTTRRGQVRWWRYQAGRCPTCGRPADGEHVTCDTCRQRAAELYRRRREAGVCGHCGGAPLATKALCGPCRDKIRAYSRRYKAAVRGNTDA